MQSLPRQRSHRIKTTFACRDSVSHWKTRVKRAMNLRCVMGTLFRRFVTIYYLILTCNNSSRKAPVKMKYVNVICNTCSVKPQSHQACDQVTTYLRPTNGPIVHITYDWWQRSYDWWQRWWVIARGKSVATRS